MNRVTSLCPECYKAINGEIIFRHDGAWMIKECPEHGRFKAIIDPSLELFNACQALPAYNRFDNDILLMDVTQRCNTRCKWCFYPTNNITDQPIESIMEDCRKAQRIKDFSTLVLFGGEPTVRTDLPALISQLKHLFPGITMDTNGIRLADMDYMRSLFESGLSELSLSLHHSSDNPETVYRKKIDAIQNFRKLKTEGIAKEKMTLMFTIDHPSKIDEVLNIVRQNKDIVGFVRLRSCANAWGEDRADTPLFVSMLVKYLLNTARREGCSLIPLDADNNLYHLNLLFDDVPFRLICWPDIGNVIFELLDSGPYYLARDKRIYNARTALFVNEAMEKGHRGTLEQFALR